MTETERDIQQLLRATENLAAVQGHTIKNVDKLTMDVGKLVGNITEIALMKKDIEGLKESEAARKKVYTAVITFMIVAGIGIIFGIKG